MTDTNTPEQPRSMNFRELQQHYRAATEVLDQKQAFFLTDILNIGKPETSYHQPTAWVAPKGEWSEEANAHASFSFGANPTFVSKLDAEGYAFILAHETMHILLNHLSLAKTYDNKLKFNVAADAVINDYLAKIGLDPIEGTVRGEQILGYDCADKTVNEVYGALPEPDEDGEGGEGGEGGYGGYSDADQIDDHDWIHNPAGNPDATPEQVEQAAENLSEKFRPRDLDEKKADGQPGYGSTDPSFGSPEHANMHWRKLIRRVNPDALRRTARRRPNWARKPRKLAASSIRLPSYEAKGVGGSADMPAMVMALDTSGSIGEATARKFVGLAQSVPQDSIRLFPCTFTTDYLPLDLENPQWASGGTCFSAVENYIRTEVQPQLQGRYPKAVVVVTDGEAYFRGGLEPTGEQLRRNWLWLITPGASRRWLNDYVKPDPDTVESLADYTESF